MKKEKSNDVEMVGGDEDKENDAKLSPNQIMAKARKRR